MNFRMVHTNLNVQDMARSLKFYEEALNLKPQNRKQAEDGSFQLVYLGDGTGGGLLELTWLKDHPAPYELGENETHIAFETEDLQAAHRLHQKMGCICFENTAMGIYFIEDPDGYWLEIVPKK